MRSHLVHDKALPAARNLHIFSIEVRYCEVPVLLLELPCWHHVGFHIAVTHV